jgi:hypothetical protein
VTKRTSGGLADDLKAPDVTSSAGGIPEEDFRIAKLGLTDLDDIPDCHSSQAAPPEQFGERLRDYCVAVIGHWYVRGHAPSTEQVNLQSLAAQSRNMLAINRAAMNILLSPVHILAPHFTIGPFIEICETERPDQAFSQYPR